MHTEEYSDILLAASPNPILILNPDFHIRKANSHFCIMFGLTPSETEGQSIFNIGGKAWDLPETQQLLYQILPQHKSIENYEINLNPNGHEARSFNLNGRFTETQSGEPAGIFLVMEDVTEKKKAEARFRVIADSSFYGVASYEPVRDENNTITDFTVAFTNPEVPANFGLTVSDVVGKTCREVYPGIFGNGIFEKLRTVMHTGTPDTYEIAVDVDGKTIWLDAAIEKVDDSVTVTSKNTTVEKEAALHLKKMNELLSGKNKELASFTYIASHDLQEPLRKIQMFTSRILENDGDKFSEVSANYFSSIQSTAARMQRLIDALLSYTSMDSQEMKGEMTDLNMLLREVLDIMDDILESKNAVVQADVLPKVKVVPIQFQQLFLNIINNAVKYSKPGINPIIRITTETETVDRKKYLRINFADNGIGFDPLYKDRIFEVFQRLHGKKEFEGTGVGLAICQKIMQSHKGFITAEGELSVGAVFSVFLPSKD